MDLPIRGHPPSQTPDDQNPFLRLAAAGMTDWKGVEYVAGASRPRKSRPGSDKPGDGYWLAQPLRAALEDIGPRVAVLASKGPDWL